MTFSRNPSPHTTDYEADLAWYFETFVPDPERGYDKMNPASFENKYIHKKDPVTRELVAHALNGATRRLEIEGRKSPIPLSLAVIPEKDQWARFAIIDIDH